MQFVGQVCGIEAPVGRQRTGSRRNSDQSRPVVCPTAVMRDWPPSAPVPAAQTRPASGAQPPRLDRDSRRNRARLAHQRRVRPALGFPSPACGAALRRAGLRGNRTPPGEGRRCRRSATPSGRDRPRRLSAHRTCRYRWRQRGRHCRMPQCPACSAPVRCHRIRPRVTRWDARPARAPSLEWSRICGASRPLRVRAAPRAGHARLTYPDKPSARPPAPRTPAAAAGSRCRRAGSPRRPGRRAARTGRTRLPR